MTQEQTNSSRPRSYRTNEAILGLGVVVTFMRSDFQQEVQRLTDVAPMLSKKVRLVDSLEREKPRLTCSDFGS